MAFVKQMALLVCVWIAQMNGIRINLQPDEKPNATSDTRIIYDQRQSGKYNIHVVIKDVAIIDMDQNEIADESYSEDDYYYDDDDLTVRPSIHKSTNKPSSTIATTTPNPTETVSFTTEYNYSLSESLNNESSSAEMTTLTGSSLWDIVIPTTINAEKQPNAIVLSTKPPKTIPAIDVKPRSKIEPIYAIEEPVLHPKYHLLNYNYGMPPQAQSRGDSLSIPKPLTNSKIYKVKVQRSHQPAHHDRQTRRCRSNQYRDSRGNCNRVHRSSLSSSGSFLKRLFSMLISLPMAGGEQHNEE